MSPLYLSAFTVLASLSFVKSQPTTDRYHDDADAETRCDMNTIEEQVLQLARDIDQLKCVESPEMECPSEFTYIAAVNGCYKLVLNNLPWYVAGLRCRHLHRKAHLVVIGNDTEHNAIAHWLKSHPGSMFEGCYAYVTGPRSFAFWTGGQRTDPTSRSEFIWRLSSLVAGCTVESEMIYTNWRRGQPDYYQNAESCVQLPVGYDYLWNDGNCQDSICSICELDLFV